MPNSNKLHFFNSSGDSLNFKYNETDKIFEGDILFDENSTDTFKTYGIYTLESVDSFEFEEIGLLATNKFQLFNEYGFDFYSSKYLSQQIKSVVVVNNDSTFYSKWIYGENFETKFPIGSLISFDNYLFEFTDPNQTFVVVDSKRGAIMIISTVDNATFENMYSNIDSDTYVDKFISGVDAVGIYNYINTNYENNISSWSEPNFYDKLYVGKKLNIIGSNLNDGTLTVNNPEVTDIIHFVYSANKFNLPVNSDLIIEVLIGTDLPKVYEGGLSISADGKIFISDTYNYPTILKSGQQFKIVGNLLNTNFFTVATIYDFNNSNNLKYYGVYDQVIYNSKLYECILGYTHSHADDNTRFEYPDNSIYWSPTASHVKVNESTVFESYLLCQIYLTKDRYYYTCGYTQSTEVTFASGAQKYNTDLKLFNIDLYYENNYIKADLIYPSKYATVNFYHTQVGTTYSIGQEYKTFERLIGVKETLNHELNYNYSENFKNNIVFTDIDEFGIRVTINKMVYQEEIAYIYTGVVIDMVRTIDRTLRNWLSRYYLELSKLGINTELQYTGNYASLFYNSILIQTQYPNVPIVVNSVEVGSAANYYIEHSKVLFNDLGPYLNININGYDYNVESTNSSISITYSIVDVPVTLQSWIDLYAVNLLEYGIIVENINNLLKFDVKTTNSTLNYTITTGKSNLPGLSDYIITNKLKGNEGVLIASNEVILGASSSNSFEQLGFATGMVFAVNNTYYPYVNQEFNIQYLDPKVLNLSYQGPFWDVNNNTCTSSPFVTIAFSLGFGQTGCAGRGLTGTSGQFDIQQFSTDQFNIKFNPNTYTLGGYDVGSNMIDIKYIQLSNSIFALGDDLDVLDSYFGTYITNVDLQGNTQSIKMEFNPVNNYLYCLSSTKLYVVDPTVNSLLSVISFTHSAYDLAINPVNGDIYVSYATASMLSIYNYNNILSTSLSGYVFGKMVFNDYESDMYVTTDSTSVLRINGTDRTLQATYTIPGLIPSIFYEPVNESIYVYATSSLWMIGVTSSIIGMTSSQTSLSGPTDFTDIIFNNLTGELNVSDSSSNFTKLNLDGTIVSQSNSANYGYLALSPYDGGVYLSSQVTNTIIVIDGVSGGILFAEGSGAQTTKLVYNPDRKSMWLLQPSTNRIVEVDVVLNTTIEVVTMESTTINDPWSKQFGTIDPDYVPRPDMWLKTRDYYRRPRENFNGDVPVKYYWKWFSDNVTQFFLYDFYGEQLKKVTGSYSYTGVIPLDPVVLSRNPNNDITKVSLPEYQQTIFDTIEYTLNYVDDENVISTDVEPLQLFIGFKSEEEGAIRSILQLYKKEEVTYSMSSSETNYVTLDTLDIDGPDKRGEIRLNQNATYSFTNQGLKVGQNIVIYIKDITSKTNQYISHNNASMFIIREIYTKTIVVDFFNLESDILETESTIIVNHPLVGTTTYLNFSIKVLDKEIGRFFTYGQTENEDIRFKIELGNVGKLVSSDDVFIFKQYDILEGGTDWVFLNKKRKEMLMMKHLIYPYIGSYKSIINAINFFGYNDLQLNEYYKDIDINSINFSKLFKVEIPDIFDNTVEGWTENDFIKHTFPNDKFEETNLLNLTYFITDKDGTNVITYSLDEIVIKLQGLKYWLKRNIIPLTHKILDITGVVYFNSGTQIIHKLHDLTIVNIHENMTPVTFKLNEVYLLPINSGSSVYNCVLDFYSIIPGIGTEKNVLGAPEPPKPYNGISVVPPDYFNIKIRTYKTYKEWVPFKTYIIGDKVSYYGKLYESVVNDNKVNNPRKYELSTSWISEQFYEATSIVDYKRQIYTCMFATASTITPLIDTINWTNITKWTEIDFEPVQTISEFRNGENLLPFNFTVDSNLDPFVVIDVTSDNGYGSVYKDNKNYEIRGLRDITEPYQNIESIGPFQPIILI